MVGTEDVAVLYMNDDDANLSIGLERELKI